MPSMSITIERTPMTLQWEGQEIQVEQLGIRLPFARKPADLKDMSASGDYVVYVTETRTMTPEEFTNALKTLGLKRYGPDGVGAFLGVSDSVVKRWVRGETQRSPIPQIGRAHV